MRDRINTRYKDVRKDVVEYNKKIAALPENPRNPRQLNEDDLNDLLLSDSDIRELNRFHCNELWATDPRMRQAISSLALLDRAEEELQLLAHECLRFIFWNVNQLKSVERALTLVSKPLSVADHLVQQGLSSQRALETLAAPKLGKAVQLLALTRPQLGVFTQLKGITCVFKVNSLR